MKIWKILLILYSIEINLTFILTNVVQNNYLAINKTIKPLSYFNNKFTIWPNSEENINLIKLIKLAAQNLYDNLLEISVPTMQIKDDVLVGKEFKKKNLIETKKRYRTLQIYANLAKRNQKKNILLQNKRTFTWESPLSSHPGMDCGGWHGAQDSALHKIDLSSMAAPEWVRSSDLGAVGRCPIKLTTLTRPDNLPEWIPSLVAVECACEQSRCTKRGAHTCITIYTKVSFDPDGPQNVLIPVDCVCALQPARLIKITKPILTT